MDEYAALTKRYRKAQEYFSGAYLVDTPEQQEKAKKAFTELSRHIDEAWEQIRHKQLEFSTSIPDEIIEQAIQSETFWQPKTLTLYLRRKKLIIVIELPEYMKYAELKDE